MGAKRSARTAAAILIAAPTLAWANGAETRPEVTGDMAYGEYLASECSACHPKDGIMQGIPPISGWHPADFVASLTDYRTGTREHPVMQMIAGRLGDEEMAALAVYFATLEPVDTE